MSSGAVQVGAETAEQHQVRGGKWFHGKVFERRNPPLRVISPPLANQTHVLPLTRNPDRCLVVEHSCQHHAGASPAAPTSQPPVPSSTEVSTPLSTTSTLLLPGLSGPWVKSIAATRHCPGLFTPGGRAVDATGTDHPYSRSCPIPG